MTGVRGMRHLRARDWRRRNTLVLVVMAAGLLLAACSSSGVTRSSSPSTKSVSSSAAAGGQKATANEVGITDTEIHVAIIADVATAVNPGLFKPSVDSVKAWAKIVNAKGGLAGRQVVVDVIDSKLDPNATRNAVIKACAKDFALVGTEALALTSVADIQGCKNAQGKAIGIPDLAGIAFNTPERCSPGTFAVGGNDAGYCASQNQHPQTYTVQAGDAKYFASLEQGLHGIWVYNSDVPTARIAQVPVFTASSQAGIRKDGEGFYAASGAAPQSAMTPIVQIIKRNNSTFAQGGSTPPNMVLLRKEAQLQGVNSVKVWVCSAGCYVPYFIPTGGSAVNDTYQTLTSLPFFSEADSNPALKALADELGGTGKLDSNAIAAYAEALLFEEAVNKVVRSGGTLNRQSLFDALKNEHSFDAGGIIGPVDVGNHKPSPCFIVAQVKDGKWQRVHPAETGKFDCDPSNLVQIKLDLTK
jgi:ABC-type branched-subunit amino acid transport system substrate-binding protein